MKKKRLSIYVTMFGLAMATAPVFTSCEDMLEEKPYDFISPDDVPDSDDGADMWTTGVYETLHSSMFRYGNMPRPFDYDCDNVSGATWQFDQFGNGNFQGSNNHCDVVWTGMYSVINRANEAIEQINEMKNLTARHRDNVLGECYFLKAWAYFMLVRAYGDIPVYSVSVNQSQQYTNSPRIPIKDVYTQTIIPLLDDAKDMLYKNTDTTVNAVFHILGHIVGQLIILLRIERLVTGHLVFGEIHRNRLGIHFRVGPVDVLHHKLRTGFQGHIENSLTVGNSKHWYLLFEEDDYRVDKGVLHCWIREGSDTSWGGGSYFPNFGKWQEMVTNLESPFDNPEVTAGWRCDEGGSEQF